ncbi:lysine-specific demethylase JMJ30-like [Gigantopelta aegis]|uniref:lysine-specific demethylase JMJ30-like n=1 Tax=Gigantopelta aegis TaxID=1735272 RepID=UPI001B88D61D|nr:lysine-specific demethylase JMJ30-like [Gigantopelta aegis]
MKNHHLYSFLLLFKFAALSVCDEDPPGHMQPICNYPPVQSVATMDDFPTPEYFFRWFTSPGHPVVFKSVLDKIDFPAYHKWTDDYLRKKFGMEFAQVENTKKETRNPDDTKQRFMYRFLDDYRQRNQYMIHELSTKMRDDVRVPRCLQCGGFHNRVDTFLLWMSSGGTTSVLHHDSYENLNCILDGVKVFKMIDKELKERIYANNFNETMGYSRVDVDKVDLHEYPNLRDIPWIEARIEKGDCIYIPKDWFHVVYSYGDRNLAVNTWFSNTPVFNASDCELRELYSEANQYYKNKDKTETIRDAIIYIFRETTKIEKNDFDLILLESARTDENRNQILEYLDADHDGVVSGEEIETMDLQRFVETFLDVLHVPPYTDDLKSHLRNVTQNQIDSYSHLFRLARDEL